MAKANKTAPTAASVVTFLAGLAPEGRRADAAALSALMARVSGQPARLWGPSIIGFGVHRYRYDSGREGETPAVGFSPRKQALVLYGLGEAGEDPARLGKVTTGVGCIYVKRLADIDLAVLEATIARAFARRASG
ncbi:MAG TPA: DUF1801 domain-containing protein [Caulobacteraceae bacterium]|jgi:hypothetical protein